MTDYFDVADKPKSFEKRNKSITDYIKIEDDRPIKVQFLVPPARGEVHNHWVQGRKLPVRCLGDGECPICARNKSIEYDNEHPDFIRRDIAYIVNVVDLTPVKKCLSCGTSNDKAATKCVNEECGKIVVDVDVEPMKAVRYLEANKAFFNQLSETMKASLSMLGLDSDSASTIPVSIRRSKNDGKNIFVMLPQSGDKDAVNPADFQDSLFDYDKTGIHVSYDEMVMLMNGAAFKDVLSKRGNKDAAPNKKKEVDDLFG